LNFDAAYPFLLFTALALVYVFVVRPQLHKFWLTAGIYGIIDSAETSFWQKLKARFAGQWAQLIALAGMGVAIAPEVLHQMNLVDLSAALGPALASRIGGVMALLELVFIPLALSGAAKMGAKAATAQSQPAPAALAPVAESASVTPQAAPPEPDIRDVIVAALADVEAQIRALSALAAGSSLSASPTPKVVESVAKREDSTPLAAATGTG
jgi:hypothetical protein